MQPQLTAHLAHLALRSPDPERAARFYERVVGMSLHERRPDGGFVLGWGRGCPALELAPGPGGVEHVALEVPEPPVLDALIARVEAAGVAHHAHPGDCDARLSLSDPDGNRVLVLGALDRSGERSGNPGHRPLRIQHVTYGSAHLEPMVDFYVRVLGFRVSDRMGDVFTWMRCDHEHHTIAVVAAGSARLDHFSFDVEGWEALKVWCDRLSTLDVPLTWGPGRHGPGNNLFVMFDDPDGNRVELSAEMERYWDERAQQTPRLWEAHPRTTNLWGPTPAWREVSR